MTSLAANHLAFDSELARTANGADGVHHGLSWDNLVTEVVIAWHRPARALGTEITDAVRLFVLSKGGVTAREVAQVFDLDPSAAANLLDDLASRGMISRHDNDDDIDLAALNAARDRMLRGHFEEVSGLELQR